MPDTPAPRHTLRNVLLGLLGVILLSLGLWMSVPPQPVLPDGEASAPAPARERAGPPVVEGLGGDFRLPATTGTELALADLRGKVVLLNFGFATCPDVCPMVLGRLGNALRELENQGIDPARVQPLFVTFDPERDSLDHLRAYLAWFHPALIGLRGDAAQTDAVLRQYKVILARQDTGSEGGYVFQHSDFIYVIDTRGRVRLLVAGKDPDAAIVEAVRALLREAEAT